MPKIYAEEGVLLSLVWRIAAIELEDDRDEAGLVRRWKQSGGMEFGGVKLCDFQSPRSRGQCSVGRACRAADAGFDARRAPSSGVDFRRASE